MFKREKIYLIVDEIHRPQVFFDTKDEALDYLRLQNSHGEFGWLYVTVSKGRV